MHKHGVFGVLTRNFIGSSDMSVDRRDNLSMRSVASGNTAFLPVGQLGDDEVLAIFVI